MYLYKIVDFEGYYAFWELFRYIRKLGERTEICPSVRLVVVEDQ